MLHCLPLARLDWACIRQRRNQTIDLLSLSQVAPYRIHGASMLGCEAWRTSVGPPPQPKDTGLAESGNASSSRRGLHVPEEAKDIPSYPDRA